MDKATIQAIDRVIDFAKEEERILRTTEDPNRLPFGVITGRSQKPQPNFDFGPDNKRSYSGIRCLFYDGH